MKPFLVVSDGMDKNVFTNLCTLKEVDQHLKLKPTKIQNIFLTPHLGASTEEAQSKVGEMAVYQLIEFFNINNLLNEVKA